MEVPPVEYFPSAQAVHVPLLESNPYPALHFVHLPVDAEHAEQVDEQSEQDDAPAAEYVIASHFLHADVVPDLAYVPASH